MKVFRGFMAAFCGVKLYLESVRWRVYGKWEREIEIEEAKVRSQKPPNIWHTKSKVKFEDKKQTKADHCANVRPCHV